MPGGWIDWLKGVVAGSPAALAAAAAADEEMLVQQLQGALQARVAQQPASAEAAAALQVAPSQSAFDTPRCVDGNGRDPPAWLAANQ